jgi:4,5-dihydroxyphthalate decarboxylase
MAQATGVKTLKTVIGSYPHTAALKDGTIKPPGLEFEFEEVSPIIAAFRRMVRALEFDVCEMAITTYLAAKEHDKPFTAIPVFVVRGFHHEALSYNSAAGIRTPKDLEGKRVGVRAYTVTTGVWARGVLASEYGVDLDKVTWVVFDEEHVQEYKLPPNVEQAPEGARMPAMLANGELDAAIGAGATDAPNVAPLIPDADAVAAASFARTGVYPINHTVVVKDSLLQSDPGLARTLYQAFVAAKEEFMQRLGSGGPLSKDEQALASRRKTVGDDPLPYGLEANRPALEALARIAYDQRILSRRVENESLFASVDGAS